MTEKNMPSKNTLTILIFLLIFFGLVMLASASSVVGYINFNDNYYFLKHQLLYGFLPGLMLFFICKKINYKLWQKFSLIFLLISIVLLMLIFVPGVGVEYNQARSWINIGGFSLQPSEIVKLTLIIYLAAWFASSDKLKAKEHIQSFSHGLLPFLILLGLISGLIALQPDVGTMSIIVLIAIGVYFVAGVRWSHILGLFLTGAGMLTALILTAPYRLNRILSFIRPESDTSGIGYHINQSLLAIGSGGLLGLGLGKSRQKFEYLPQVYGDSVFAVMAEELGFIISVLFIIFFIYFIFKILSIAHQTNDNFVKLFGIGMAVWIGGQAMINIGAMVGVFPLTGVPLPFISYGGTSLMMVMAGCGILTNMANS
jgi:cell division protein FtsW